MDDQKYEPEEPKYVLYEDYKKLKTQADALLLTMKHLQTRVGKLERVIRQCHPAAWQLVD
jgi:hypothetical protein